MADMNWNELLENAAESGGFEPVPDGPYNVVVDRANNKKTSNGKQMYAVMFKIEDGPYKGRTVWANLVISPESPNALGIFFRHMNALGLDSAYFNNNPLPEKVASDLVGRRASITVGTRRWNNQDRNEVNNISPPTDGKQVDTTQSSAPDWPAGADNDSAPEPPPF